MEVQQQRQRKPPPLQLASTSLSALGSSAGRASLQALQSSSLQHGFPADQATARQSTVCSLGGGATSGSSGSRGSLGSTPRQGSNGGARFNFFSRALRFGIGAGGGGAAAFVSGCLIGGEALPPLPVAGCWRMHGSQTVGVCLPSC